MRIMLASMLPWAKFRKTYGAPIVGRELVRRRLARLAGLIVGCDALVQWCAGLIDQGYRGGDGMRGRQNLRHEESQKEAAIELFMKTHGGRSFLHGHLFGDNVHEYLAPCIYEGEGEMLAMGFFKSLVKAHGVQFFEPIGKTLQVAGIRKPNMLQPGACLGRRRRALALRQMANRSAVAAAGRGRNCRPCPAHLPPMPSTRPDSLQHARRWKSAAR